MYNLSNKTLPILIALSKVVFHAFFITSNAKCCGCISIEISIRCLMIDILGVRISYLAFLTLFSMSSKWGIKISWNSRVYLLILSSSLLKSTWINQGTLVNLETLFFKSSSIFFYLSLKYLVSNVVHHITIGIGGLSP